MTINITAIKAVSPGGGAEKLIAQRGVLHNNFTLTAEEPQVPGQALNHGELLDLSFEAEGEEFIMKKMTLQNTVSPGGELLFAPRAAEHAKILYTKKPSKNGRPQTNGAEETDLQSSISPIPWEENIFSWGMGIDVISGEPAATAVQAFTPAKSGSKITSDSYKFIENESDYNSMVNTAASGQYNVGGLKAHASAEYLQKVQYSKISITLMASYETLYDLDEMSAGSYMLTPEAEALINSDPTRFRELYGDYFVAGGRRASTFTALYVCETTSESSMQSFRATFGAQAGNVFSAEGSTAFENAASEHGVSTDIHLTMKGVVGVCPVVAPYTPAKIIEALNWFKQSEEGTYAKAKLLHYSNIVPAYSKKIPVKPEVFAKLSILFLHCWDLSAKAVSCPKNYKAEFKDKVDEFVLDVEASKSLLAKDETLLDGLIEDGRDLALHLDGIFARMDFYLKVQECIVEEPEEGDWHKEDAGGLQTWVYGLTTGNSPAVNISQKYLSVQDDSKRTIRKKSNLYFKEEGIIIVGWEVLSQKEDGWNGWWKKNCANILGKNEADVKVESRVNRGYHWGVNYYYVTAADYLF